MYYRRAKSLNASLLTVLTNRLGDALILSALVLGLYESSFLLPLWDSQDNSAVIPVWLLITVGTFTKRAQLPFCAWLPAAMAAPTPVSSLVHSSTLVTAGVYVLIRLGASLPKELSTLIITRGRLTMLLAGIRALGEGDIKKIVALSTLSQLGIIVVAIGIGLPLLAFFHLIAHAFFKALLFIGVGNLIHAARSYQDFKVIGGFSKDLSLTRRVLVVAKASLCGLPFFSGFFSKEAILEGIELCSASGGVLWLRMVLGILLTQLYSLRFILKVVLAFRGPPATTLRHDQDTPTNLGMLGLLLPAVLGGTIFLSLRADFIELPLTPSGLKGAVLSLFIGAPGVALYLHGQGLRKTPKLFPLVSMWLLPRFRGQVWLPVVRRREALQKSLSLGFVDRVLAR